MSTLEVFDPFKAASTKRLVEERKV